MPDAELNDAPIEKRLPGDPSAAKKPRQRKPKAIIEAPAGMMPLESMSKDLKLAAATLGAHEARFLVKRFYQSQQARIRTMHQMRQLAKGDEPHGTLRFVSDQDRRMEGMIKAALEIYTTSSELGRWAQSIIGIGPIIVAGLMAHINIEGRETAGQIWRFAGMDPTAVWLPKTKRPWNADLKRLCFIIGESFTKFAGHPNDLFGKLYLARKGYEIQGNDEGRLVDQARQALIDKNYGKKTEAIAWYSGCYPAGTCAKWNGLEADARKTFPDDTAKRLEWLTKERASFLLAQRGPDGSGMPMLPPGRILLRAQRYPVKLFLSHYHHVAYELFYGRPPPFPYILDRTTHLKWPEHAMHREFIKPPNWPRQEGFGKGAKDVSLEVATEMALRDRPGHDAGRGPEADDDEG